MLKILTVALLPSLLIQGYFVKKHTPRLPEPEGQRKGTTHTGKPALSILIVGDSAAAGVGVAQQEDALLGALLKQLSTNFTVSYQLEAKTGDTTEQLLIRIRALPAQKFDLVISSIGVNDVTKLILPKKWLQQQKVLYSEIEHKFSPQQIMVTAVPAMNHFPALPNPLAWLFGRYSTTMNIALQKWIESQPHQPKYSLISFDVQEFQTLKLQMASDGFHPAKEIYQLWGQQIVEAYHYNKVAK